MAPLAAQRPSLAASRPGRAARCDCSWRPTSGRLDRHDPRPGHRRRAHGSGRPGPVAGGPGLAPSVVVRDATGLAVPLRRRGGHARPADSRSSCRWATRPTRTRTIRRPARARRRRPRGRPASRPRTSDATFRVRDRAATGGRRRPGGAAPRPRPAAGGVTSSVYGGTHGSSRAARDTAAGGRCDHRAGRADRHRRRRPVRTGHGPDVRARSARAVAAAPIPALATRAFLDASARAIGETMPLEIAGVRRTVALVGEVEAFPTVDPADPGPVVDLPTLALARFEGSDAVDPPTEWWFAARPRPRAAAVAPPSRPPVSSRSVLTIDARAEALATDPVALGIIGALAIGFVAAAMFAVVGFIVSAAVSARERVTEFALLRALGLSAGQLSSWLSLENAVLAGVSLVTGSLLGLVIAWVVLPFVTVTQTASTPYPPVSLAVPWLVIGILEVVAIVALTTTVIVLAWLLRRVGWRPPCGSARTDRASIGHDRRPCCAGPGGARRARTALRPRRRDELRGHRRSAAPEPGGRRRAALRGRDGHTDRAQPPVHGRRPAARPGGRRARARPGAWRRDLAAPAARRAGAGRGAPSGRRQRAVRPDRPAQLPDRRHDELPGRRRGPASGYVEGRARSPSVRRSRRPRRSRRGSRSPCRRRRRPRSRSGWGTSCRPRSIPPTRCCGGSSRGRPRPSRSRSSGCSTSPIRWTRPSTARPAWHATPWAAPRSARSRTPRPSSPRRRISTCARLGPPAQYRWRFFTDVDRLDAGRLETLLPDLRRLDTTFGSTAGTPGDLVYRSGLLELIDQFSQRRATTEATLAWPRWARSWSPRARSGWWR